MAEEKILNTRIVLKNDSLEKWNSSSLILKTGEVALAKIEAPQAGTEPKVPTYLMKIGDGVSTFAELNWLAASAADVYSWAKKEKLAYADLPETLRTEITNLKSAVGEGGSVAESIQLAIQALDVDDAAVANQFVTAVAEADGKISVTRRALAADDIPALGIDKITGLSDKLTALENADAATSEAINSINSKIGEVSADKTLVQMIADAQAAATYDDTAVRGLIQANTDAIDAIEADYLKAADKTELANAVALKANQTDLEAEVTRAKAAEKVNADEIARVNGVLVAAIENEDDTALNSIKELADWINTHGTEASDMAEAIQTNAGDIDKLEQAVADFKSGTVIVEKANNAENAVNAENAENAAEANHAANADHATTADKVGEIAAADVATKSDVATAKQEAIDAAAADATAKANAAQAAAEATAAADATSKANAAEANAKAHANSLIADLDAQLAVTNAKNVVAGVTQVDGKLTAINEVTLADIAFSGSTDDLVQGAKTLVFDCGSSSTVI